MEKNIYFYQESTNSIMDLADELTYEELGLRTLLKATYIKYGGLLPLDKVKKYSHYQGSSKKLQKIIEKTFIIEGDLCINNEWNLELKRIKNISEKARIAVQARWAKRDMEVAKWESFAKDAAIKDGTDVSTDVDTTAYTKQHTKTHTNCKLGTVSSNTKKSITTGTSRKFMKPKIEEVKGYCLERKNSVDPDRFINYYDSNGWKVGKNSMKDWKAAIRTWEKSSFDKPRQSSTSNALQRAVERFEGGHNDVARIL